MLRKVQNTNWARLRLAGLFCKLKLNFFIDETFYLVPAFSIESNNN